MIEKEERDKIGKAWVNIARRDIPKHHRVFTNFHKKQLADAKRCSETCQREACATSLAFLVVYVNGLIAINYHLGFVIPLFLHILLYMLTEL